jgi:branched-chain amino acid transport system permease protein
MIDNLILLLQNPVALVDLAINGVLIGAIFVLVAYGMALVWGVMNIINICQGEFVILGGFVAFYFSKWGINPLFGVPAAFALLYLIGGGFARTALARKLYDRPWKAVANIIALTVILVVVDRVWFAIATGSFALGSPHSFIFVAIADNAGIGLLVNMTVSYLLVSVLINFILFGGLYSVVIVRIVDRDLFTSILATFGISIFMSQTMNEIFSSDVEIARHGLGTWTLLDGGITLEQIKLVAFGLSMVIGVALVIYMRNARSGQAIRATAQNARAARIMGIDTDAVYARTYALNAAICGAAGALVAMIFTIQAYGGLAFTIRGFLVVIVAGLGNLAGVIVAGLSLGAAEQVASFVFGLEYQLAFVFGMLVLIVMYRQVRLGFQRQYLR